MSALDLHTSFSSTPHAPRGAASASRLASGTVVCDACGCRLTANDTSDSADRGWRHFAGNAGRDARGCTVACAEMPHSLA